MEFPPLHEEYAVWALIDYESARARALELRIGPELFTDPALRVLARCAMLGRYDEHSDAKLRALGFSAPGFQDGFRWKEEKSAVRAIDTLVRFGEQKYLAQTLRWGAETLDRQGNPWVVREQVLLAFAAAGWTEENYKRSAFHPDAGRSK